VATGRTGGAAAGAPGGATAWVGTEAACRAGAAGVTGRGAGGRGGAGFSGAAAADGAADSGAAAELAAGAGVWAAGVWGRAGSGVDRLDSPSRRTANTALQTLQRARTPATGTLAGSTRYTVAQFGQVTFISSPQGFSRELAPDRSSPFVLWRRSTTKTEPGSVLA
jgi:hypothetical protein